MSLPEATLPISLLLVVACSPEEPPFDTPPTGPGPVASTSGSVTTPPTEETVPQPPLTWVAVDTGWSISCGVLDDGRLACWGDDENAAKAMALSGPFVQVAVGGADGCALREDGSVACWCMNSNYEELCNHVPPGVFRRVEVSGGHACAEDLGGRLQCWGDNREAYRDVSEDPVLDWSLGNDATCVIPEDHTISCVGSGNPAMDIPPPGLQFTRVVLGTRHACGLDTLGLAHCWGETVYGVPFPDPPLGTFDDLVGLEQAVCGIRPDRTAECWYDHPDLNDLPPDGPGEPPWEPPAERWASIGPGALNACGLTVEGELLCWEDRTDRAGEVDEAPDLSTL